MTPALDALLKEVERVVALVETLPSATGRCAARGRLSDFTPGLAAMLRVAVEALYGGANLVNGRAECRAALARIEQMAKGDARA